MSKKTSEKQCTTCLVTKDIKEFYSKGKRTDTSCKNCIKEKRKAKYVSTQESSDFNRILNLVELIYESEDAALTKLENNIDFVLVSSRNKKAA